MKYEAVLISISFEEGEILYTFCETTQDATLLRVAIADDFPNYTHHIISNSNFMKLRILNHEEVEI